MNYSDQLKSPKWQKKRLQVLNRDKFTCKLCKDTETTLHIHHIEYTADFAWEEPIENLVTLCEHCHKEVEQIKNDIDFKDIKIYKSIGWIDGSRIMFVSHNGIVTKSIYESNGKHIIGFNFSQYIDIDSIIKIFNHAKKY